MRKQILQDTHNREQGRQHLVLHALFMAFIWLLICVDFVSCSGLVSLEHLVCSIRRKQKSCRAAVCMVRKVKFFRIKGEIRNITKHLTSE